MSILMRHKNQIYGLVEKGDPVNGAVFITDVQPQTPTDNVGNKVYSDDGSTLIGCSSTSIDVAVTVIAITGHTNYKPVVEVNGVVVNLTARADAPMFEGTVNITLDESSVITAIHEDGPAWQTTVTADLPPVISGTTFINNPYPGTQTELKEDDSVSVMVSADLPFVKVEFENFGALKPEVRNVTSTTSAQLNGLQIANRGNSPQSLGYKVRVQKDNGTWSGWFETQTSGANGVNYVILNNLKPSININSVVYPTGQSALKDTEQATINHNVTNYDTVSYNSSQLTITNPSVFEMAKVVNRLAGDYTDSGTNFTINATRTANGSSSSLSGLVNIAHVLPTVEISVPYSRLRSGGTMGTNAQTYTVTITSDQKLSAAPTVNIPEGTWLGTGFSNSSNFKVWTRQITIHDNNIKGVFSFNSLSATGLSNKETTAITGSDSYTIGGFVLRTIQISPYPNRGGDIGTTVANTSKLRCTNLSKGDSGSLNFSYANTLAETTDKFTITDNAGTLQSDGQYWYNLDGPNAASNTTGEMLVEIEEVI